MGGLCAVASSMTGRSGPCRPIICMQHAQSLDALCFVVYIIPEERHALSFPIGNLKPLAWDQGIVCERYMECLITIHCELSQVSPNYMNLCMSATHKSAAEFVAVGMWRRWMTTRSSLESLEAVLHWPQTSMLHQARALLFFPWSPRHLIPHLAYSCTLRFITKRGKMITDLAELLVTAKVSLRILSLEDLVEQEGQDTLILVIRTILSTWTSSGCWKLKVWLWQAIAAMLQSFDPVKGCVF